MIKRLFYIAAISLCLGGIGVAQQNGADAPASKEDVERYLQVMHSREMMTKMVDMMSKPMHDMVHQQYLKNQDKLPADFETRMNKRMDEMMKDFPWDDLMNSMIPVYQKHFTKGDIDALVAFYATPTGQKLIRELPEITAEAMQNMMPLLQKRMETMQKGLQEDEEAIMKENQTKSDSSTPQKSNN
jgi:uncharacterized protein